MQEILDIFLEKSKHHHSNIIYAQIYKNDVLKEEFSLFLCIVPDRRRKREDLSDRMTS